MVPSQVSEGEMNDFELILREFTKMFRFEETTSP